MLGELFERELYTAAARVFSSPVSSRPK